MKVAIFDLETSNVSADYGIVLCAVMLPVNSPGSRKPIVYRLDEMPTYPVEPWNDKELVLQIRDELEKWDIIVGYNSKRFDIPFLNARLVYHRERTLKPIKHIDLLYVPRFRFKISNATLETVSHFLGTKKRKTRIDGQQWVKVLCCANTPAGKEAMDYIVDHCKRDVQVLKEIYEQVKDLIFYIKTS